MICFEEPDTLNNSLYWGFLLPWASSSSLLNSLTMLSAIHWADPEPNADLGLFSSTFIFTVAYMTSQYEIRAIPTAAKFTIELGSVSTLKKYQ